VDVETVLATDADEEIETVSSVMSPAKRGSKRSVMFEEEEATSEKQAVELPADVFKAIRKAINKMFGPRENLTVAAIVAALGNTYAPEFIDEALAVRTYELARL
jgi:hypothetical protein